MLLIIVFAAINDYVWYSLHSSICILFLYLLFITCTHLSSHHSQHIIKTNTDENGFKCHMTSDSHLRQMKIFRENAGGLMDSFSREFEVSYLETLRRRHGTQRMNANNVYQEVIQDKHHVHMNSTKWSTLSDFVQYLGKKGLVIVEETERGWYVTYIERDPALLARQEALKKKTEADAREEKNAAERREMLRKEAAKALDRAGCNVERKASEIGNRKEGEKINMEMKLGGLGSGLSGGEKKKRKHNKISLLEEGEDDEDDGEDEGGLDITKQPGKAIALPKGNDKHAKSIHNEPFKAASKREPEQSSNKPTKEKDNDTTINKKHKSNNGDGNNTNKRKDYWLYRDIVVRIISKKLANGEYYKRKAIVDKVINKYTAEIEVLETSRKAKDGGDILRIDQDDLETVIPKEAGEKVRIVNGGYRGKKARVLKLNKKEYRAELKLVEDESVVVLDYEDFSKIA